MRTGPTTRAELDRLLADSVEAESAELSGIRLKPVLSGAPRVWARLLHIVFRTTF